MVCNKNPIYVFKIHKDCFSVRSIKKIIRMLQLLFRILLTIFVNIVVRTKKVKGIFYLFIFLAGINLFASLLFDNEIEKINYFWKRIYFVNIIVFIWIYGFFCRYLILIRTKGNIYLMWFLIFLAVIIPFCTLVPFEKLKNSGHIESTDTYWISILTLFVILFLLFILKTILDIGEILFAAMGGLITVLSLLIFSTTAAGLYLTAMNPSEFPKDIAEVRSNSSFLSYILSYSYRGATQFFTIPASKENGTIDAAQFIVYLGGILFLTMVISFFVSYFVSIHFLKHMESEKTKDYSQYLRKSNRFMVGFMRYMKCKQRICKILILHEIELYKVKRNYDSF